MVILFSVLFVSVIDAAAEYQHKSYNYFCDSQGNFKGECILNKGQESV